MDEAYWRRSLAMFGLLFFVPTISLTSLVFLQGRNHEIYIQPGCGWLNSNSHVQEIYIEPGCGWLDSNSYVTDDQCLFHEL